MDQSARFGGRTPDVLLAWGVGILGAFVWWSFAWISDDSYFTFRTIEVWFAGYGPNFNSGQRVWGTSSPLWFLLLSAGRLLHRDLYWVALALSAICTGLTFYFGWRMLRDSFGWVIFVLLLLGSRVLLDYSSSGLETPLMYALLTAFMWRYLELFDSEPTPRDLWTLACISSLVLVTRHDLSILIGPLLLWVFLSFRSTLSIGRWAVLAAAAAAPLLLWTAFSAFYYGSLVPPAIRAKLGFAKYGDTTEVLLQGIDNLAVIAYDPISILVLVVGFAVCVRRARLGAPLAVGSLLYLGVYTYHGGDWMDARIFTPVLIALLPLATRALVSLARPIVWVAAGVGAVLCLTWPDYPWETAAEYITDHREIMKGWNEYFREGSHGAPTVTHWCPDWAHLPAMPADPATTWVPWFPVRIPTGFKPPFLAQQYACGRFFRGSNVSIGGVYVIPLGLFSYFAGADKFIVERFLFDPLLTRLPPSYLGKYLHRTQHWFRPGHVHHDLPIGYIESLIRGENRIEDPAIARLYDDVVLATQGPLLASGRFAAIWRLNTGHDYGTDAPWNAVWGAATY